MPSSLICRLVARDFSRASIDFSSILPTDVVPPPESIGVGGFVGANGVTQLAILHKDGLIDIDVGDTEVVKNGVALAEDVILRRGVDFWGGPRE